MKFVDGIQRGERADELSAAFAMDGCDVELLRQHFQETGQAVPVNPDFRRGGGFVPAGDQKMNFAAGFFENGKFGIQEAGAGNDAAKRVSGG